jgi:inosose dehydratase
MTAVSSAGTSSAGGRSPVADRVAGAPISWGVCEVPGWGYQLEPDTVLRQMRELGLAATEFGPDGFLPDDPQAKAATLAWYGLKAVGQFVPVVLHDPGHDPLPDVERAMEGLVAARASTVVIAAATGRDGYDDRPVLDETGWSTLLGNLDRITGAAAARGLVATLHPHVGTMVESGEETARVLAGSRIGLCLDTGHLIIGGGDPVAVAQQHPGRIVHTHLKDVRIELARRVQSGEVTYTDAVAGGMYVPLGAGDVDIRAIVAALEGHGYAGWYVLEQDTILAGEPGTGGGGADPVADVRASLAHLLAVADGPSAAGA